MEDFTGLVNTMKSNFKTFEDDMIVLKMAMYSHSQQTEGGVPKIKVPKLKALNKSQNSKKL